MNKKVLKDVVYCSDCGVILKKAYASSVEVEAFDGDKRTFYYCEEHKKPYDIRRIWFSNKDSYYKKEVRVDSNGKLIK